MQFQVPQFTETETKLIGPLTLKQFLWIAGGGAVFYIFSFIVTSKALIVVAIIIGAISAAFAFVQVQNVSLVRYLIYALKYFLGIDHYEFQAKKSSEQYLGDEHNEEHY